MWLKKNNVVEFNDNYKIVVLAGKKYNNREFYLVAEMLSDESDIIDYYMVMEGFEKTGELEKVVDVDLLLKLKPLFMKSLFLKTERVKLGVKAYFDSLEAGNNNKRVSGSTGNYWKGRFFELMDRLVKWQKHGNHEPLDLLTIYVEKNYDNTNPSSYHELMLIGLIEDSERDIRSAMSSRHPVDIAFFDEMNEWFELGAPLGMDPAYYQKCGPIDVNLNLLSVMRELKSECEKKYPGAEIRFPALESAKKSSSSSVFIESDGKSYSLQDYEKLVETAWNTGNIAPLKEHAMKINSVSHAPRVIGDVLESWLEFLAYNCSLWGAETLHKLWQSRGDYEMAASAYEIYVSAMEENGLKPDAAIYARIAYWHYMRIPENISYDETKRYEGIILKTGQWYNKAAEAGVDISGWEGEWCVAQYLRYINNGTGRHKNTSSSSDGCYIATAVYGSYDCPEVWTLRRFRDEKLRKSTAGRLFVKTYYAVSPTVVRLFGETEWFNGFWHGRLDAMVERLKSEGYDDTPYYDR